MLKGLGVKRKPESEAVGSGERWRRLERGNVSKRRPRLYEVRIRKEEYLYDCEGGKKFGNVGAGENKGLDADFVGVSRCCCCCIVV